MMKPVVLVVEDEPLLRLFATDMIEEAGFEVLQAPNASAALMTLEERLDVRVVFTDVNMPGGIDGIMLAICIRRRWPTWSTHLMRTTNATFATCHTHRRSRVC